MVNLFNNMYSLCTGNSSVQSSLRALIRFFANKALPIFFWVTKNNKEYRLIPSKKNPETIVSLTSFPDRINKVWLVIEVLLRQTRKPDKIKLWLSKDQFSSIEVLPNRLLSLQKRGLEIELRKGNLRSHKKYFYALKEYPDAKLITVDDDIFYRTNMIEKLLLFAENYPKCIVANYVRKIKITDDELSPYNEWSFYTSAGEPNYLAFFGSGGGTLFQPQIFPRETLDKETFMQICSSADDVWLNLMTRINNFKVVKTDLETINLLPITGSLQNLTLSSVNLMGQNDTQIDAVRKFCIEKFNKDPMKIAQFISN
ncbi:MAG TPA: hypothetical protein VL093_07070 [Flavipsychrobacter sp.]|nr:hypothetical protein [Flavipsychrobacter sp.]